jgi:tRNA threonylcarbamoyladenosine biosynthesis protein TsaE
LEFTLTSENDIQKYLSQIFEFAQGITLWLFVGEMGSGKTTTIKSICEFLNVSDEVSSPTFSIVNEYFSDKIGTVYHFDCYRIKNDDEAIGIGIEDYFYSGYHCFVEWPQKVEQLIPDQFLILNFEKIDETTRLLKISKYV